MKIPKISSRGIEPGLREWKYRGAEIDGWKKVYIEYKKSVVSTLELWCVIEEHWIINGATFSVN